MNIKQISRHPIIWVKPKRVKAELFYDFNGANYELTTPAYETLRGIVHRYGGGRGDWGKNGGFMLYGKVSGYLWDIPINIFDDFKGEVVALLLDKENWEHREIVGYKGRKSDKIPMGEVWTEKVEAIEAELREICPDLGYLAIVNGMITPLCKWGNGSGSFRCGDNNRIDFVGCPQKEIVKQSVILARKALAEIKC